MNNVNIIQLILTLLEVYLYVIYTSPKFQTIKLTIIHNNLTILNLSIFSILI